MSSLARWTYTRTLTIWPNAGTDEYGQPSFNAPYTIKGSWEVGKQMRTAQDGQQFVPSSVFYAEFAEGSDLRPAAEDRIARGDLTNQAAPPATAERIRSVTGYDMAMFGAGELPDWEIATG